MFASVLAASLVAGLGAASGSAWAGAADAPEAELGGVEPAPTAERDGFAYPVSRFVFEYPLEHPDLPEAGSLGAVEVPLVRTEEGFIGPVPGAPATVVRLGNYDGSRTDVFYGSAIAAINQRVRDHLEREHGMIGQLVTPDASEIDFEATRRDLRPEGDTELTIQVWRAAVGEVRTIGFGDRIPEGEEEIDSPVHERVRRRSRVGEGDLLRRPPIDEGVFRLNRHPGRRVDVAIAPSGRAGEVVLDYLVYEPKPWSVFVQVSNTGTESTDRWRYRTGFIHNQLTGQDDILRIDYITAGFNESHAVFGSYEFPLGLERLRLRAFGSWNKYTASDVGIADAQFRGEGFEAGGELILNVFQAGPAFVDLVGGLRYEHIDVDNRFAGIRGRDDFLLPYVGARLERYTPLASTSGEVMLEFNLPGVAGTSREQVERLGRFDVERSWAALKGSASHSFFLEPLLNPSGFAGERGPDQMTLAHEVALSARGQYTFGDRVAPNFQQTAGGFYTVRGYRESQAVGDNALIASAEYRFHLIRALPARAQPEEVFGRPFRARRAQPYGNADWDIILRTFVDVGRTTNNDAFFFESNETLVGAGVGAEVQVRNNVSVRVDYGVALRTVGEGGRRTESGDSRVHFVATLLF